MAKQLGATTTYTIVKKKPEAETIAELHATLGYQPGIILECSGASSSIRLGMLACKARGVVVLIGMGADEVKVPLLSASCREVDIRGIFRYKNSYPKAINLISSGIIDVKPLISHRFKLEEAYQAFELARSGKGVKIMIDCSLDQDKK